MVAGAGLTGLALAQSFPFLEGPGDLPGSDFGSPFDVPGNRSVTDERAQCRRACDQSSSCMA